MTSSRPNGLLNRANLLAALLAAALPLVVFVVMVALDSAGAENAAGLVFGVWLIVGVPGTFLAPLRGWVTMAVIVLAWALGGVLVSHLRSVRRAV